MINFKLGRILKWREMVVTKDYEIIKQKQNSTIEQLESFSTDDEHDYEYEFSSFSQLYS